jgi:hypothetical protein
MRLKTSRYVGFLYVAPALAFVLVFTAYPLAQMVWMSLHNWSLIAPKKFIGLGNFVKAWNDPQVWTSLGFTLKYTLLITPILMVLGYLIALLTAENRPLRQFTRSVVFAPVVIGLGASSLLWYWLFATEHGYINHILLSLGLISRPVIWLGVDVDLSHWAIITSVAWKRSVGGIVRPRASAPGGEVQALAPDGEGGLWMAVGGSFYRYTDRPLEPVFSEAAVPVADGGRLTGAAGVRRYAGGGAARAGRDQAVPA